MALRFLNNGYFAGSVGIGTDSPDAKLDVTDGNAKMVFGGASSDRPLLYFQHNAVPVDGEEIGLLDFRGYNSASQDTRYVILTAKAEDVTDGSEDGSLQVQTMKAGTATTTMVLRSGNVGIGTDLPSAKLQVGLGTSNQQSTIASIGGTGSSILNALSLVNTAGNAATNQGVMLTFHLNNAYSPTGQISVTTENAAGTVTDSSMKFWTYGSNYLPRMTIDSIGNVGIGVEDPQQKLQVEGNSWIKGIYYDTSGDAGSSGNVLTSTATGTTWVSAGTPGSGIYLPLAGGTMDSGATITTSGTLSIVGNSAVKLRVSGGARIQLENANVTDSFYISNTGGNLASTLDLGGTLSIIEGGAATFAGDVLVEDNLYLTDAGTVRGKLILNASDRDNVELRAESLGSTMKFFTVGTQALLLDASQNATFAGNVLVKTALLSNQENTDVSGLELVAQVAIATYTAAFFDFVVKKGTNVRSGTVYACHDGTNVQFTETSTQDIGDTSDVVLSVDISGGQMRLLANAATAAWSVKSLIRAI